MSNASTPSVGASDEPSLTASAIVAPLAVFGSHILRIGGYSRTKGLGKGKYISSETFIVGGHRWCLRYYPDGLGYGPNNSDWISFMLHCNLRNLDEVKARFTISLLDQDGIRELSYNTASKSWTFSARPSAIANLMGYPLPLIKKKDLDRSVYLKDDVFSVRCDISVTKIFTKAIPVSEVGHGVMGKQE